MYGRRNSFCHPPAFGRFTVADSRAEIRLEMIFMVSLITGALGVVATVNGRTIAVGTDHVEWGALACVAAILLAGLVTGTFYYRLLIRKTISKIK